MLILKHKSFCKPLHPKPPQCPYHKAQFHCSYISAILTTIVSPKLFFFYNNKNIYIALLGRSQNPKTESLCPKVLGASRGHAVPVTTAVHVSSLATCFPGLTGMFSLPHLQEGT